MGGRTVDGEGTITIRTKPYPGGKRYQVASMSVCNTDTELLAQLVKFTGIGRVAMSVRATHKRKEIWRWQTDQRQAAAVVVQLLPWLTAKRRVGELLLEFQTLRRCGKFMAGAEARQVEIVKEVRAENQRGSETASGQAVDR
jgi:hypothetical protein